MRAYDLLVGTQEREKGFGQQEKNVWRMHIYGGRSKQRNSQQA